MSAGAARGPRATRRALPWAIAGILLLPAAVDARVVRVEVDSREVVSAAAEHGHAGPYEVIKGVIHLEVDPDSPANQRIVDLHSAPRDSRGRVPFRTEFELHKPVHAQRGNHRLLYLVNNRGRKMGVGHFTHDAGKNWLYSQGWSYLWCGWNVDVIESDERFNIHVPVATNNGETITGKIYAEIVNYANQPTYSHPFYWGGSVAYPVVSMDNAHATLTMRPYRWEAAVEIPRDQWSFARLEEGQVVPDPGHLYIAQGFTPGWLYELV